MSPQTPAGDRFLLPDGHWLHFRPVRPDDQAAIDEAIRTSSPETLHHRFFTPLRSVTAEDLRRMLMLDPTRDFCVVGELEGSAPARIVCGARYVRQPGASRAEIAFTVHDEFQHRGVGRHLMRLLIEQGRREGVKSFVADVLADNTPMLRLLQHFAPRRRSEFHAGVCRVEFDLADTRWD